MRGYLSFIAAHPRFLAFGVLAAFFSSFGQTFFIALFGGELRASFALSHGEFGALYSGATLASGLTLIWLGRAVDRIALGRYTILVSLGLAAACFVMAAAPTAAVLVLAFYLLRLTGQGLLSHLSAVAMGRHFVAGRGRGVSVAALGHPVGEAVFPAMAVGLTAALGWRGAWLLIAVAVLAGVAPLMLWLLKGHVARTEGAGADKSPRPRDRSLGGVLRDPLFYPLTLCTLAPGFIVTGLFFHQVALADAKGWSLSWLASCFVGFAGAQLLAGLASGSAADRLGTVRLLPGYLLPLALAATVVASFQHPVAALAYMLAAGATAGAQFTVQGALWAELYGVRHLGAIRGLVQALMVLATAGAPVLFGALLDRGVGFQAIGLGCAGYAVAGAGLLAALQPALRRRAAGS